MLPTFTQLTSQFEINGILALAFIMAIGLPIGISIVLNRKYKKIESPNNWQHFGSKVTVMSSIVATVMSTLTIFFLSFQYSELLKLENFARYQSHRKEFEETINSSLIHPASFSFKETGKLYYKIFPYNKGGRLDILPEPLRYKDQKSTLSPINRLYYDAYHAMFNKWPTKEYDKNFRELKSLIDNILYISNILEGIEDDAYRLGTYPYEGNRLGTTSRVTYGYNLIVEYSLKAANTLSMTFPSANKYNSLDQIEKLALIIEQLFETYNTILKFTDSPLAHCGTTNLRLKLFYIKHLEEFEKRTAGHNMTTNRLICRFQEIIQFLLTHNNKLEHSKVYSNRLIHMWTKYSRGSDKRFYRALARSYAECVAVFSFDQRQGGIRITEKGFAHKLKNINTTPHNTAILFAELLDRTKSIIPEKYHIKRDYIARTIANDAIKLLTDELKYYSVENLRKQISIPDL